jgi:undecaprenyl-diphosphatase
MESDFADCAVVKVGDQEGVGMDAWAFAQAAFLGLIEGLTEFIPVSSTGHLILTIDLIGFRGPPGKVFEIAIQLGAILAVCVVYAGRLSRVVLDLPRRPKARRFAGNILLAFLPAMVIGAAAHDFIKQVLFSPWVVSISLIVGGLAILLIERIAPPPRCHEVEAATPGMALGVGFCQTLAMIPGVSRSGATIMGALMLGMERRAAAEFSFFLAIPTMFAATAYDLYKNRALLNFDDGALIATGFVAAFIAGLLVVRSLLAFISRRGFAPFAWYRMAVGGVMLAILLAR